VHLIFHRECDCYETTSAQLARFVEQGLRFDDDGFRVEQVEVLEDFPSLVGLHVILVRTPQVLVNEAGEVLETNDEETRLEINVALVQGPEDRWLVRTLTIIRQS
jgi:hypothetical protein